MGLESASKLAQLNPLWPLGTDPRSQGDDHLRLIKKVVQLDALSKADGGTIGGSIEIESGTPELRFHETDAVGPGAGRFRLTGGSAGNFGLQGTTVDDWSSSFSIFSYGGGTGILTLGVQAAFGAGVSGNIDGAGWLTSQNAAGFQVRKAQINVGGGTGDSSETGYNIAGYYGGAQTFGVRRNGNAVNANNSWGAISDERQKRSVVDATPKLADLNRLRIVNFVLNDDPTGLKQIGLIGQEVREVFPGLVEEDEEGLLSVKYSVLVPMLVKALQELTARLGALEAMSGFGGRDT